MQTGLFTQYDKEIDDAITEFKINYDEILTKAETEKKILILKIADIIKRNFEAIGTLELIKNDIASMVITIINNRNVISISERYIIMVLKPLGYTNIYNKRVKNEEQIKDEQHAIQEIDSAVIHCNNVVKDLNIYKKDVSEKITELLTTVEFRHFKNEELSKLSDQVYNIYTKMTELIEDQKIETELADTFDEDGLLVDTNNQNTEANKESKNPGTKTQISNDFNKIDKPRDPLTFKNEIPQLVLEAAEEHKLMYRHLRKYYNVTKDYPEFNKDAHDNYASAWKKYIAFMQGLNSVIKPNINLKFRRDAIGWIEILEVSEKFTDGAGRSRSMVPAKYYDKHGKLIKTNRKLSKEHVAENIPYAKQMKQTIKQTAEFLHVLNQYYIRNIQPFTNGFNAKYHDKFSNSA